MSEIIGRKRRGPYPRAFRAKIIEFGGAQPHHAYCFANRRATRMKVLMQA